MFLLPDVRTLNHPASGERVGRWSLRAYLDGTRLGAVYAGDDAAGDVVELRMLPEVFIRHAALEPTLLLPGVSFWRERIDAHWVRGDWVAGVLLERLTWRSRFEPPAPALAARLVADAARATAALHAAGRIHGLLRAHHVAVQLPEAASDGPAVTLCNPGQSRLDEEMNQTSPGVGSLRYLSPARVRGERLTEADDVWSLGLMLWELLARRRLIHGSVVAQLRAIQALGVAPDPGGDPDAGALAVAALSPEPSRPTAAELAAGLEPKAGSPDALRAWCGRRYPRERAIVRGLLTR